MRGLIDFQNAWARLVRRYFDNGIQSLTPDERVWFCCQSLAQAIFDGGLISYYFNSGANDLNDCLAALEMLGEHDLVRVIRQINSRLFPSGVPAKLDDRNRIISSWPDDGEIDDFLDPIEREAQTLAK